MRNFEKALKKPKFDQDFEPNLRKPVQGERREQRRNKKSKRQMWEM